jgi:hypothetical protein
MDSITKPRTIVLECSEYDYDVIQDAMAKQQTFRTANGTPLWKCRGDEIVSVSAAIMASVCDQYLVLRQDEELRDEERQAT